VPPGNFPRQQVITQRQFEQLRELLRAVLPANPFYTAKYEAAEAPSRVARLHDFHERFPFTTKAELGADQAAHPPYGTNLTLPLARYTRCHQTSGTTGTPLRWLDTPETWDAMVEQWVTVLRVAGVTPADTLLLPFSFGPFLGFWLAFEAGLRLGCRCLPAGGMSSAARAQAVVDHRVSVLCATPTYALHLAETAAREGIDLTVPQEAGEEGAATPARACPVRLLVVAGEPGGSLPAVRERLSAAWHGARVVDHHGMTETGPVTFECPAKPGTLHVMESAFLPEIIDPATGAQRGAGETGELVLTTLTRTGSPLLRYRTGDLVRSALDRICECGRSDLALEGGILGRVDDMVIVRGVNVYPGALDQLVRAYAEVAEYRVTLSQPGALVEMAVEVEPGPGATGLDTLAHRLETALETALTLRVPVTLVPAGALPRFELKARRWVRA
jgi:phenylacetate-CoA ligase